MSPMARLYAKLMLARRWRIFRILREEGAKIQFDSRKDASSALCMAADHGRLAVNETLLERGADINYEDSYLRTFTLTMALERRRYSTTNLFFERGVDVSKFEVMNRTPLWWAARHSWEAVVKYLVAKAYVLTAPVIKSL